MMMKNKRQWNGAYYPLEFFVGGFKNNTINNNHSLLNESNGRSCEKNKSETVKYLKRRTRFQHEIIESCYWHNFFFWTITIIFLFYLREDINSLVTTSPYILCIAVKGRRKTVVSWKCSGHFLYRSLFTPDCTMAEKTTTLWTELQQSK